MCVCVCVCVCVWTGVYAQLCSSHPVGGGGFIWDKHAPCTLSNLQMPHSWGGRWQIGQMTELGSKGKLTVQSDGVDLTRWNLTGTNMFILFYLFICALPP